MSRVKTSPTEWRIEDPARPWLSQKPYGTRNVGALTGSNMLPMTSGVPSNPADLERNRRNREAKARQRQRELAGDPRPNTQRCGKLMPLAGEPCARLIGHKPGDCRTRTALDYARDARPSGRAYS